MKAVFYGTPEISVPYLELLARRCEVAAVVTQPDQPAGRSLRTAPTPVKARAAALGLAVLQPARPSEIVPRLAALAPDLAVAVAYGRLLKADALAVPRLGTLNVHFSLLPKFRGAAPVQWSLVRGETRTGVSVFWLDEGMDTGPLFLSRELEVGPDEDAAGLFARLSALGLDALGAALDELEAGRAPREPQRGEASQAPLLRKEDGRLDLGRDAKELHDLVRGLCLWPRAALELAPPGGRKRVLVLKTRLAEGSEAGSGGAPGTILRVERGGGILVQCGSGSRLWVLLVQPEGKNPISAADFVNGLRLGAGGLLPLAADIER